MFFLKRSIFLSTFFSLCILLYFTKAIAAPVPLVSAWNFHSPPNGIDYRTINSGSMTINVTDPQIPFTTWPHAKYPAIGQDFVVSVDFSNYFTQGAATTDISTDLHSDTQLAIQWDAGEINGEAVYNEIDIRRTTFNNGWEGFSAIYSTQGESYNELHQVYNEAGTDNNGTFVIEKSGNSVTVTVKNTVGTVLHSWIFNSLPFGNTEIQVNLRTINGPRESTSVQYSNFDMDPVPSVVQFFYLQHRYFENGSESNRFLFSVFDTSGNYVSTNTLTSIQLFDPSDTLITTDWLRFDTPYDILYGKYDATNGRWNYGDTFSPEGYFYGSFSGIPSIGNYRLSVTTESGIVYNRNYYYYGNSPLPLISSQSFYAYKDAVGNLFLNWAPPNNSDFITSNLNTSARAWIDVYEGETIIAEIYITLPTHQGYIFIPSNVVQLYEAKGTDYRVGMHVRTNNNSTRSYSNTIPLVLADGPPLAGDSNEDGRIGLEEAINALKITAGN